MNRKVFGFELGSTVTDIVTGLKGKATCLSLTVNGQVFISAEFVNSKDETKDFCVSFARIRSEAGKLITLEGVPDITCTDETLTRPVEGLVLGDRYKDSLLGHSGVATSYSFCLTGCDRAALERVIMPEQKVSDYWIDVTRLEPVEASTPPVPPQSKPGHTGDINPGLLK